MPVAAQQQRPNIMFVYRTPNLDQLASEGMMFTDYYEEAKLHSGSGKLHHRNARHDHRSTIRMLPSVFCEG